MSDEHSIIALQYAHRDDARREAQFLGPIDNPERLMPISYYVWLILGPAGPILVDTGFTATTAERFGRSYVASPRELVASVGVDPDSIRTVVLTHLHYDHAGGASDFPNATFVVQQEELRFWTGRHAHEIGCCLGISHLVLPEDIASVSLANIEGRVQHVNGAADLAEGISVHRVGGHTPGMQVVSVATSRGTVVLASDASHYYENLARRRPYAITHCLPDALDAFTVVCDIAGDQERVVPGHDPEVLGRFPTVIGCPYPAVLIA